MYDVHLKNGYCKIANKIMDKLCEIRVPGEAMQCLLVIIRKSYGFNKKQDCISLSQFEKCTGLKRPNICRALNKLETMKLISIIKKDNVIKKDNGNIYKFNKHYELWTPLSKKIMPQNVIKKDNKSLSKKIHTKDNSTKDIYASNSPNLTPFLPISLKFHCVQKKDGMSHQDFNNGQLNENSTIVLRGAQILEKLHRIDKEGIEDIKKVLQFILQDDDGKSGEGWHGWKRNVVSLSSLRNKRNGEMKYFKIKNQMPVKKRAVIGYGFGDMSTGAKGYGL